MRVLRPALLLLVLALPGCAVYQGIRDCGWHGCPGDEQISSEVRQLLYQHVELRAPNQVYVQTLKRVVYLSGQVATDLQREIALSVASQAAGVHKVVNNIAISYEGR